MIEQAKNYTTRRGDKIWYLPSKGRGYYHRLNGPAVEWSDGSKEWRVGGKRHRLDGPAVKLQNGTKKWWVDDKLHRIDGPAIVWPDGTKKWWVGGERHRLTGPAVEWSDGSEEWWIEGKQLPTEDVEIWLEKNDVDLTTEEGQMAFKLRWS